MGQNVPQAHLEETISQKESAYLDSTPHGNIITGYDGYIKGSGSAAHKRKPPPLEQNRVFTRSSISYRSNAGGVRLHPLVTARRGVHA